MGKKDELERLLGMNSSRGAANALHFEEPESKAWEEASKRLNDGLNKNQVWAMCQALHPLLRSSGIVLVKAHNDGKMRPATELQGLFSMNTNKLDMTRALALILCVPANLQHYVDRLTKEQRELWQQLLNRLYISETEAKKILHTDTLIYEERVNGYYYYNRTEKLTPPELMFLAIERSLSATIRRFGYRQMESFLTIPAAIHPYFLHVFRPETTDESWIAHEQLPQEDDIVCNFEADAVAKFPLLQGLLKAGKLPMKVKGVGLSDIKRVAKSLALLEFFNADAVKGSAQEGLRAFFYIDLLARDYHLLLYDKGQDPIEQTLRRMFFFQFPRLYYTLLGTLLPHIKGLRRRIIEENRMGELLKYFLGVLCDNPTSWVDVADTLQQSFADEIIKDMIPYSALVFNHSLQDDSFGLTNDFSQKIISVDSFASEFGLAALQSMSLIMCSLGMAEVALSPLHRPESPFARVKYIRLTALGRFALNVDQTYKAPKIDQTAFFELDPERLIIRSLVNPNPYEQLLKDSSVPISKNRYETSANSFLAHCKSREDVEKNISIFRQFISNDLPPLWNDFFADLLLHCNPLKRDKDSFHHFVLSPDNADLIRLITGDEKLRQLVIRAEGYRILVKNTDIAKFESRLKQFGYLL